jgi:hypothetical protein
MTHNTASLGRRLLWGLTLISVGGCSQPEFEADVAGNVTLDGAAVGPGTVVFVPSDGVSNPPTGTVQINGEYFLKSNRIRGLPPGHYKAAVSIIHQDPVPAGERSTVPAKLVSPAKYADPAISGLEFDVEPGENIINIDLSSK